MSTLADTLVSDGRQLFRQTGQNPIPALEKQHGLAAGKILGLLAEAFEWPVLEIFDMQDLQPAFDLLPLVRCMSRRVVLLRLPAASAISVVIDHPFDSDLIAWLESLVQGARTTICLASDTDIKTYLEKQENTTKAIDSIAIENDAEGRKERQATLISLSTASDSASPAVKLVNSTLYDALKSEASDIHFECTPEGITVKYRIDGVMNHATTIPGIDLAAQVISRIKVLAELDISERRIPQDGSFQVTAKDHDIDLRVSIMPSIHGEDAVIRILDKRAMIENYGSLTLQALRFDDNALDKLRMLAEAAHGMLLVTGPTGSGKTTTLYAAISETNHGRDKVITIEDPVEYQLPGVLQIPVNDKKGLTFAKGLRSILRHDPDKIMVGEIRDAETAEIAVQSALTGHLVLTTVHANNVFDVFSRFTHMGIDPFAFASALNGIWAQRLVRVNCPRCARPATPSGDEILRSGLAPEQAKNYRFMAGEGCGDCRGSGYRGRRAIAEILVMNDEIRELIIEKAHIRRIKETARKYGTQTMRQAGLMLVKGGETTLEEIRRVTLAD